VKAIAEDISCMPLDLFEIDIKGNKQFATKNKMFNMMKNTCNSDGMLAMTMIETIIVNCLLWGNGYIQKVFNKQGEIIELFPLFSSRMEISRNDSGDIIYIYTKDNGTKRIFKKIQIINIPLFSLDGIKGLSVVKYSNNSLLLTDEAEKFGRNFFKSGSRPSGILEMEIGTKLKDKPATINEWTKSYSGSDNVGKIAILEGGMKYKSIGIPPEDAQFLETRQFQILEICRWFRIPPHKIGDLSRATFSNIEQQNIDYLSVLKPLMRKIEKTLSVSLLEDYSLFFKFDSDSLLRGDFESRMRGYAIASQNGIMSSNEIRGKENINANQNGDELMVNGNMIPLAIAKKGGAGIETKK
jgi:HK97 family phage portal protein